MAKSINQTRTQTHWTWICFIAVTEIKLIANSGYSRGKQKQQPLHTGGKFWGDDRFSVGFNDQVKFATLKSKCRLSLTIAGSTGH